jgi:hypothetical protein
MSASASGTLTILAGRLGEEMLRWVYAMTLDGDLELLVAAIVGVALVVAVAVSGRAAGSQLRPSRSGSATTPAPFASSGSSYASSDLVRSPASSSR